MVYTFPLGHLSSQFENTAEVNLSEGEDDKPIGNM